MGSEMSRSMYGSFPTTPMGHGMYGYTPMGGTHTRANSGSPMSGTTHQMGGSHNSGSQMGAYMTSNMSMPMTQPIDPMAQQVHL